MDILAKFKRLVEIMEASGEEDPEPRRDDSGDGRGGKLPPEADASAAPGKEKNRGGGLAPAAKYATALQNFPEPLARTGMGNRPMASANAMSHINKMFEILGKFIDEFGELSLRKKKDFRYDKVMADPDAPKEKQPKDPTATRMDKYNKLNPDVIYKSMNDFFDPKTDPQRRKSSMTMFWEYLWGIAEARRVWLRDAIDAEVERQAEAKMKVADDQIFSKGKKVKVNGELVSRGHFKAMLMRQVKANVEKSMQSKIAAKDKEFEQEYFLVKEAVKVIQKQMQTFNNEGRNYEYIPGAFGKPPQVIERESDADAVRQHNRAVAKVGSGEKAVTATRPTVRKGGAPAPAKKSASAPKVAPAVDVELDDEDLAALAALESVSSKWKNWDRMLSEAITLACADHTPQWWEEV